MQVNLKKCTKDSFTMLHFLDFYLYKFANIGYKNTTVNIWIAQEIYFLIVLVKYTFIFSVRSTKMAFTILTRMFLRL